MRSAVNPKCSNGPGPLPEVPHWSRPITRASVPTQRHQDSVAPASTAIVQPSVRAGQRARPERAPFHQTAVCAEQVSRTLGNGRGRLDGGRGRRHVGRASQPLSERLGGELNAEHAPAHRLSHRATAESTKALEILDPERLAQPHPRVRQHRAVAAAEHEPAPVEPVRIRWIAVHKGIARHPSDLPHARMSAMGPLRGFHGRNANGVCLLSARAHQILSSGFGPRQARQRKYRRRAA